MSMSDRPDEGQSQAQTDAEAGPDSDTSGDFWAAADALHDGLALFDRQGGLIAANRAFRRALGTDDHAIGQPISAILDAADRNGLIRSGDPDFAGWLRETGGSSTALRSDIFLQEGEGGWIRLTSRGIRSGEMICQISDITQQMRIWAAVEAIPDGFVLFDSEDRMVICNQSYRDIYQTSAPVMNPGISFEEILRYGLSHGEYPEAQGREEAWISARLQEHRGQAAEGEHQLKDGRWLRSIDKETPDGGRVGLRVDITHLREQAVALEAARLAAESANRAKSAFLANMSHEIRTPMNGVVGMAELLCDTILSDEQRLFAETIRSSGEALLVIINDILDYSKIEAERLTLHPVDFDLERTIHEVVMLLQPRAGEKGIDLMIDYDVFLPTRFTGDPGRLRQVLTNLIGNAVKFTEKGHVLTRVVGMEVENGCHQLHVTVEDTGIGIPNSLLDHVFGEFYQVDDEQNRKFEGTGLGLAITRRLVERMGGAVWVDSEHGKGSVFGFRLSLPLAEDSVPARMPVGITSAMVVDDQFINRTILERQLAPCGIEILLSRSGADALAEVQKGADPDVVLIDHDMPGMDGLDLGQRLRDIGYVRPMVLLSSNIVRLRGAGADHFDAILQKPVLRAELYRQLTNLTNPTPEQEATPLPPAEKAPGLRAMRILAAEDNRTNQLVLQKMVRDLDIDLHFAANGHEAVALWQQIRPDLIFMDISMPGMDGKEATAAIRAQEKAENLPAVPIVALTAHAMQGDETGILAAGMDRFMTKPLRKSEICEVVREMKPEDCRAPDGTS
ncbi:response regulator [Xinfangfangia sp. D13-10-4-6]|nr:response regulator [Pseudogemmobacter hezensis]